MLHKVNSSNQKSGFHVGKSLVKAVEVSKNDSVSRTRISKGDCCK